jgi:hypothetical protein
MAESCVSEASDPSDDNTDMWNRTDRKLSDERFLRTSGMTICINSTESVAVVVSGIIGDYLIKLLAEHSDIHHTQNVQPWKASPKTVKMTNIIKAVFYLLNCALFNAFFARKTLKMNQTVKYKKLL